MSCSAVFSLVSICDSFHTCEVSASLPNACLVSSMTLFGFSGDLGGAYET